MRLDERRLLISRSITALSYEDFARVERVVTTYRQEPGDAALKAALVELITDKRASRLVCLFGLHTLRTLRLAEERDIAVKTVAGREWLWIQNWVALEASRRTPPASLAEIEPMSALEEPNDPLKEAITRVYSTTVRRTPVDIEIDIWKSHFSNGLPFFQFLNDMAKSPEAQQAGATRQFLDHISDGEFIQLLYETVVGRGCSAEEIVIWRRQLHRGLARLDVLNALAGAALEARRTPASEAASNGHSADICAVLGTGKAISSAEWITLKDANTVAPLLSPVRQMPRLQRSTRKHRKPVVSAIASLFKGGKYIEEFLSNITAQTIFAADCELIIIDANSPEGESKIIEKYCRDFPNIVYRRTETTVGIYEAWNIGIKLAGGEFITNTNLDDSRRRDSLELQSAVLNELPFVDIVYQDFWYSFEFGLSFEELSRIGVKSRLPVVTPHNMMKFNSPHNAPMWRRSLHDRIGFFDESFRSAGDYDFWLRALHGGAVFYKVNEPHVAYFQNPEGLSTRADTRGVEEAQRVTRAFARKIIPTPITEPMATFQARVAQAAAVERPVPFLPEVANRYALVQSSLRDLARRSKFPAPLTS